MASKKTVETQVSGSSRLDVDAVRELVQILEASEITQFSWKSGEERLSIRRGPPPSTFVQSAPLPMEFPSVGLPRAAAALPATPSGAAVGVPAAAPAAPEKPGQLLTSPFVGTFYRTPAPDQPSFVEVGSVVRKGQVLCIVEAMKLMNEIESETAGRVVEILVQNGQAVEFGQPLFRIEPV